MGNALHSAYRRFVDQASALGFVKARGHTPREQMEGLLRAGPWLEPDVRRLVDLLEAGVYGAGARETDEGVALCRRLTDALPELPPLPEAPEPVGRTFGPLPDAVGRALPPFLLAAGVILLAVVLPRMSFGAVGVGGRGGGRGGHRLSPGTSPSSSPWTNSKEKAAVRELSGEWGEVEYDASFEDVHLPEYQDVPASGRGVGFDLDTGTDHHFFGLTEPFDPPLNHHHRQFVFDRIGPDFELRQPESPLRSAEGPERDGGTIYRADVRIHLRKGVANPVPDPAPDGVVIRFDPPAGVTLRFVRDPADGLRVIPDESGAFRLRYEVQTETDYLLAPLPDWPLSSVSHDAMPLPENVLEDAKVVIRAIGRLPAPGYADTVRRLHAYCAGFDVAPIRRDEMRRNEFLTVALARKGTCRHRAMVFVVVANALGVPARLVTNDIHAFAEVKLPTGSWRALEFRLLDSERHRPSLPADWSGLRMLPGMLVFGALVLLFGALVTHRHRQDSTAPLAAGAGFVARGRRRALRDEETRPGSLLLRRLVQMALDLLTGDLGLPPGDRIALRDALGRDLVPRRLDRHVLALLELEEHVSPSARLDRFRLSEAYWSAKVVLRYREERSHS